MLKEIDNFLFKNHGEFIHKGVFDQQENNINDELNRIDDVDNTQNINITELQKKDVEHEEEIEKLKGINNDQYAKIDTNTNNIKTLQSNDKKQDTEITKLKDKNNIATFTVTVDDDSVLTTGFDKLYVYKKGNTCIIRGYLKFKEDIARNKGAFVVNKNIPLPREFRPSKELKQTIFFYSSNEYVPYGFNFSELNGVLTFNSGFSTTIIPKDTAVFLNIPYHGVD